MQKFLLFEVNLRYFLMLKMPDEGSRRKPVNKKRNKRRLHALLRTEQKVNNHSSHLLLWATLLFRHRILQKRWFWNHENATNSKWDNIFRFACWQHMPKRFLCLTCVCLAVSDVFRKCLRKLFLVLTFWYVHLESLLKPPWMSSFKRFSSFWRFWRIRCRGRKKRGVTPIYPKKFGFLPPYPNSPQTVSENSWFLRISQVFLILKKFGFLWEEELQVRLGIVVHFWISQKVWFYVSLIKPTFWSDVDFFYLLFDFALD